MTFYLVAMDSSKDQKTQDLSFNKDNNREREKNVAEEQKEDKHNDSYREASSPGKIFLGGLSRSTTTVAFTLSQSIRQVRETNRLGYNEKPSHWPASGVWICNLC